MQKTKVGKIPWRRQSLPTPAFWPGEFHGLYSPWHCKELDTTEWFSLSLFTLTLNVTGGHGRIPHGVDTMSDFFIVPSELEFAGVNLCLFFWLCITFLGIGKCEFSRGCASLCWRNRSSSLSSELVWKRIYQNALHQAWTVYFVPWYGNSASPKTWCSNCTV